MSGSGRRAKRPRGSADRIREKVGRRLAEGGYVERLDPGYCAVRMPKSDEKFGVMMDEGGWRCECPEHENRGAKCLHICAVEAFVGIARRAERAGLAVENGQVRRLDDRTYLVDSQTEEGVRYKVRRLASGWACRCAYYRKRDRNCKHALAVQISLGTCHAALLIMAADSCPRCGSKRMAKKGALRSRRRRALHYRCDKCDWPYGNQQSGGGTP